MESIIGNDRHIIGPGGIENYTKKIIETQDGQKLADMFKWFINESYGVKSSDGRSFIKSKEVLDNFKFTNAYDILYMELATDDKAAAEFYNGIFPKDVVEAARKQKEMAEKAGLSLVNEAAKEATDPVVAPTMQPSVPLVEGQVVGPITPFQQ